MRELLRVILGRGSEQARSTIRARERSWVAVLGTMGEVVHQGALPGVRARSSTAVRIGLGSRFGVLRQNFFPVLIQDVKLHFWLSLVLRTLNK